MSQVFILSSGSYFRLHLNLLCTWISASWKHGKAFMATSRWGASRSRSPGYSSWKDEAILGTLGPCSTNPRNVIHSLLTLLKQLWIKKAYMPMHLIWLYRFRGFGAKNRSGVAGVYGYRLHCYDFSSTCGAKNKRSKCTKLRTSWSKVQTICTNTKPDVQFTKCKMLTLPNPGVTLSLAHSSICTWSGS